MKGKIINISRFCTDDGPGIRTAVFLKGCPLRCWWCHNPESQSIRDEMGFHKKKCIDCGACLKVCEYGSHEWIQGAHIFHREKCIGCGKCSQVCPTKALEKFGETVSVEEILAVVERDIPFYRTSGGGITISGGEPLFQPDFTAEILRKSKQQGIHTAIETSGYASQEVFARVVEHCDLVLFDIKETREDLHKQFTGVPLSSILENLSYLERIGKAFIIRAPIIPTLNDRTEHFQQLERFVKSLKHCQGLQMMKYHTLGVYKYELLQREYLLKNVLD